MSKHVFSGICPPLLIKEKLTRVSSDGHVTEVEVEIPASLVLDPSSIKIHSEIASGAYGKVFLGSISDSRGKMDIAVKKISLGYRGQPAMLSNDQKNNFLRELEFLPNLRHPNIVKLIGYKGDIWL